MTAAVPGQDGLADFEARLRGGIYQAVRRNRPHDPEDRDSAALENWPGEDLVPLAGIRTRRWDARAAATVIASVTERIRAHRPFLAALLFSPDLVLRSLRNPDGEAAFRLASDVDAWVAMCLVFEAAWDAVNAGGRGIGRTQRPDPRLRPRLVASAGRPLPGSAACLAGLPGLLPVSSSAVPGGAG